MAIDMHKVLSDRQTYGDDVVVKMGDEDVRLGDLRAGFDARIGDLTRREQGLSVKEQEVARRDQELEVERGNIRTAASRYAEAAGTTQTTTDKNAYGYTPEQWSAIQSDPFVKPIIDRQNALDERLGRAETEKKNERQAWEQWQIASQVEEIAKKDPRYQNPAEKRALLEYAADLANRRDITSVYRIKHLDETVKQAEDRAYERGMTEGKKQGAIPAIPYGTRAISAPAHEEKLPPDFAAFHDEAMADPALLDEIRNAGP